MSTRILSEVVDQTIRYKVQSGKFVATFEVDKDGKMTFYDGINSHTVKKYHFEGSDPEVVERVAKLMLQAVKLTKQLSKEGQKGVKKNVKQSSPRK